MKRALYLVRIDASGIPLADVEQGNPVRTLSQRTLSGAVQVANAFLFGAGMGMRRGPRALKPGATWDHCCAPGVHVTISRESAAG